MSKFNQAAFNRFVIEQGILGFFEKPIKLVSGRESSWYVNWRNVAGDVYGLDKLSDFVTGFVGERVKRFECFYGTPDGATKLAVLCQYKWSQAQKDYQPGRYAMAMGRKVPKEHGETKDRFFVGAPKGRVVVLEDVTTTGGSLLKSVERLLAMKIEVVAAVALTNRNEVMDDGVHVGEKLKELGVLYVAMSNAVELLPIVVRDKKPNKKIKGSIVEEFAKFGEKQIRL